MTGWAGIVLHWRPLFCACCEWNCWHWRQCPMPNPWCHCFHQYVSLPQCQLSCIIVVGSSSDVSRLGLDGSSVDKSRNSFRFVFHVFFTSGTHLVVLIVIVVILVGWHSSKSLRLHRFKSGQDEIWPGLWKLRFNSSPLFGPRCSQPTHPAMEDCRHPEI